MLIMKRILSVLFIISILALSLYGCGIITKNKTDLPTVNSEISSVESENNGYNLKFTFEVIDQNGNTERKELETNYSNLGTALQRLGLIKGEEGPYGLYIKDVNGIAADYDKDGTYWALYINDEYSMTGVDQIEIKNGYVYSFRIETM